jgi:hypothetical protein
MKCWMWMLCSLLIISMMISSYETMARNKAETKCGELVYVNMRLADELVKCENSRTHKRLRLVIDDY